MSTGDRSVQLREAWERAIAKNRPLDALAALEGLEQLEPQEPRWPHRRGEVLRRLGREKEAVEALVHAVRVYVSHGFLTRAAALAKTVVEMSPARVDILDELDPAAARKLRDDNRPARNSPLNPRMPAPPRLPSGTMGAVAPPPPVRAPIPRDEPVDDEAVTRKPPPPAPAVPAPRAYTAQDEDDEDERPSMVAGVRADRLGVVAAAMGLEPAKDSATDEVRFDNVPDVFAIDIDVSELESQSMEPASPGSAGDAPEIDARSFEADEAPSAVRLALMSGATLFADVPQDVMTDLVGAATLLEKEHGAYVYRRNDEASGLYVLVEGMVLLMRPELPRALALTEGQIFGEDCLLDRALHAADVRVKGRMLALRIPKDALDRAVKRHPAVGDVLFEVLVRRLITGALQSSPLFSAFDIPTRKELARIFEVRRAAPGVVIKQRGKRSDGLYLALAGELEVVADGGRKLLPLGTMFGQTSLLSNAPEKQTIVVRKEAVVLRLSAAQFIGFAARFPAALLHLKNLANEAHSL